VHDAADRARRALSSANVRASIPICLFSIHPLYPELCFLISDSSVPARLCKSQEDHGGGKHLPDWSHGELTLSDHRIHATTNSFWFQFNSFPLEFINQ
jgi:hypothetical protein